MPQQDYLVSEATGAQEPEAAAATAAAAIIVIVVIVAAAGAGILGERCYQDHELFRGGPPNHLGPVSARSLSSAGTAMRYMQHAVLMISSHSSTTLCE